ncbi:Signal transducer regulating beta-lactamase production, contains metallopeptidase domain [Chitinophaga rupis]|uniref:Signal transducer regulating beta-lactamase production, contains metallopeptidase domain n=1 Tax=Chitinophaga rupis TaxID=573321 RepID=A0A1H7ZUV1_9BACT|nr:M56 family metallopeptidase [Chitinophaga rupis]SEM62225.1 Signal transducer regulating beta-lactamase production, contains metallopeptidase domain [Chitinophaga rupis]
MHTLSNDMVRAIGWTLIHSLWQGLILAVVAGILILFTRKAKPALRYNIFTVLFFVLVGSAVGTFFYELQQLKPVSAATAPLALVAAPQTPVTPVAVQEMNTPAAPGFTELFITYFNEHAPLLVMFWFIIFAGKLLWLFSGLVSIQRIRYYKTTVPDAALTGWLQMLAVKLQMKRRVQLLESAMVKVPTAIGMLKPVILMPIGLMAQLPPDQVEAVLLHELAHIRRRDFLVNLIQHFAETIFFFNPALLWLSARIREEREHCCDDMAIAATQSKKGYIEALVGFQELYLTTGTRYGMAFPGKKQQLLHRVKRILGQHHDTLNVAEKSFLLVCFSLIGMLGMVFSHPGRQEAPIPVLAQVTEKIITAAGSKPQPEIKFAAEDKHKDKFKGLDPAGVTNGTTLQFEEKRKGQPNMIHLFKGNNTLFQAAADAQHKLLLFKVNGREVYIDGDNKQQLSPYLTALQTLSTDYKVPYKGGYQPYQPGYQPYHPQQDTVPVLHKANATYSGVITNTTNGKVYKISVDNNRMTGLIVDGVQVPQDQLPFRYAEVNAIFRQMEGDAAEADLGRKKMEIDRNIQEAEREREKAEQIRRKIETDRNIQEAELKRKVEELEKRKMELDREAQRNDANQKRVQVREPINAREPLSAHSALQPAAPISASPSASLSPTHATLAPVPAVKVDNSLAEEIVADMMADGLITQKDNLRFHLSQDKFVVNDKPQSDQILKRYKQKYIKSPSESYTYSRSAKGTSSQIHTGNKTVSITSN